MIAASAYEALPRQRNAETPDVIDRQSAYCLLAHGTWSPTVGRPDPRHLTPVITLLASDFTDHLTAWGTAGAAAGTVATLIFLVVQLTVDLRARRERERQAQAGQVSAWINSEWIHNANVTEKQRTDLLNASGALVYRAVIYLVFIQGGPETGLSMDAGWTASFGYRSMLSVIPPGRSYIELNRLPHHMFRRHGIEMAFTDRSGVHWLRSADGSLREIDKPAPDYYGLPLPHDWGNPEELSDPANS